MSKPKHMKKKNTGLLYEFLVRSASHSLVEGDVKKSNTVLNILRRHFKPGTELYKEFRLTNSLVRTTVSKESVASRIISEARTASRMYDVQKLESEKNDLLKDISRIVKDDMFFDQQVNEYKTYATIQNLLNEWRKSESESDIGTVAKYEDFLISWLLSEKKEPSIPVSDDESPGTSRLVVKVMTKKINEKYKDTLLPEQVQLIRAYALSKAQKSDGSIRTKMSELKESVVTKIEDYIQKNGSTEKYVVEKMNEVKDSILKESLDDVNDDLIVRFLSYMKLNQELSDGE